MRNNLSCRNISAEKKLLSYILAAMFLLLSANFIFTYMVPATTGTVNFLPATGTFDTMQTSVTNILNDAFTMVQSWIIPAAALSCAVAFVVARLPGMDQKTVQGANQVFWGCIFAVVAVYAIKAILGVAKTLGESIQ